jgi:hypothetical protein
MGEEVAEADVQSLGAGGGPKWAVVRVFENAGPAERGLQRGCGVVVGADRVVFDMVRGRPGRGRSPASSTAKTRLVCRYSALVGGPLYGRRPDWLMICGFAGSCGGCSAVR